MTSHTFVAAIEPAGTPSGPAWWFAFSGADLLVREGEGGATVPCLDDPSELSVDPATAIYMGTLGGQACYAADARGDVATPDGSPLHATLPAGYAARDLRGLYGALDESLYALAGRAVQLVEWSRTHHYCGRDGTPTAPVPGERARRCPACGLMVYPRLSPAVIVRVTRGEEVLLARSRHWPEGFYSVLAGFVEPGETLEEAARREILEEVGLEIRDLRYFASQPWPYPNSLMLGFTAQYAGGEIRVDDREIADAGWYRADALPGIPGPPSIARRLLDDWLDGR